MADTPSNWLLVNHLDCNGEGVLTAISGTRGERKTELVNFTSTEASGDAHPPWFLGIKNNQVILLNPETKKISLADKMPTDAFPAYSYQDPNSNRIWFMNDGDKDSGNDTLNCGDKGSTVTIIDRGDENSPPTHIKTLCVGRGHHVTTFISPTSKHPKLPNIAYVSNLLDGSICVVGNDESNSETYLNIIHTINLCEQRKEKDGITDIPNNAFPHGKQFSEITAKVYSLNNGYGLVDVIDPITHEIESRIPFKGYSNLLLSRCGNYIIGKGADRKTDEEHVIGRLAVLDVKTHEIIQICEIPDFYPSTYRFNPSGDKLYVTSAATGKGIQKEHLNITSLFIYDTSNLPKLNLVKELEVGVADCGRRPVAFPTDPASSLAFIPNPSDGTVSIIDGESGELMKTVRISAAGGKEFNFSLWETSIYGA